MKNIIKNNRPLVGDYRYSGKMFYYFEEHTKEFMNFVHNPSKIEYYEDYENKYSDVYSMIMLQINNKVL